jgi:hypothetical protein
MPSASSPTSPAPSLVVPSPSAIATLDPNLFHPMLGPSFPKAGAIGVVVIALAYFSLGVAVGGLMKQSPRARRWLPILIVPGLLGALAFVVWVIRSLM